MQQIVVAIFDTATQSYSRPAFVAARGAATRSFSDEINRPDKDNPLYQHPDDFDLYMLTTWDDSTGEFQPMRPELLVRGKDLRHDVQKP